MESYLFFLYFLHIVLCLYTVCPYSLGPECKRGSLTWPPFLPFRQNIVYLSQYVFMQHLYSSSSGQASLKKAHSGMWKEEGRRERARVILVRCWCICSYLPLCHHQRPDGIKINRGIQIRKALQKQLWNKPPIIWGYEYFLFCAKMYLHTGTCGILVFCNNIF